MLALHACDTATDDALARAVGWGSPLVLAAPCCHHDVAAQLRRATPPAPYASLVRHGILRERFADTLTDALRASLLRLQGYRVDVVQFVESRHTPRNTMLRAVRTGDAGRRRAAGGVRRAGRRVGRDGRGWRSCWTSVGLREAAVALVVALPFGIGLTAAADDDAAAAAALRRPRDRRVQRPGRPRRAAVDGQRLRRRGPGLHRRPPTAGPWASPGGTADPVDVEALAPGPPGRVWVGDIGDNTATRDSVSVTSVPVGRGEPTGADPRRTGSPTPAAPATPRRCWPTRGTGRLVVVTKGVLGGQVLVAPRRLDADRVNRLRPLGSAMALVTDGAFLPDGRHVVLRDYSRAVVYTFPGLEEVGEVPLPEQQQGEGIAVAATAGCW